MVISTWQAVANRPRAQLKASCFSRQNNRKVVAWDLGGRQPVAELVARPLGRADLGTLVLLEGRDGAAEEELEASDPQDGRERA